MGKLFVLTALMVSVAGGCGYSGNTMEENDQVSVQENMDDPMLIAEAEDTPEMQMTSAQQELELADTADLFAKPKATPIPDPVEAPAQPTENSPNQGYNQRESWWFRRNSDHLPPSAQDKVCISQYGGYYLGDTQSKTIYLTFDEGYENGYTAKILDVLKENEVPAAFFVTKPYMKEYPDLVKRMAEEGHIVGNHSVTHPDFTTLSDEQIAEELQGCADYYKEITGLDMPNFFRPPEGVYSIRTLEKAHEAGYKTIFWSYAYKDWDPKNQPGRQAAIDMAMNNYHNGCIMLLHAVSESNTEALDEILKSLKEKGYTFLSLEDLPENGGIS